MKRIAAVAALMVTMLAVPAAAAMASTGGSGSTHPGQSELVCPPPNLFHHRPHVRHFRRYGHHRRSQTCAVGVQVPQQQSQNCPSGYTYGQAQSFSFEVASGSSTAIELSGPILAAGEEFTWDGSTYTIWSVNPGGDSFTMSAGASLFVNGGAETLNGAGQLLCSN